MVGSTGVHPKIYILDLSGPQHPCVSGERDPKELWKEVE